MSGVYPSSVAKRALKASDIDLQSQQQASNECHAGESEQDV